MKVRNRANKTTNLKIEWELTPLESINHDTKGWVRPLNDEQEDICSDIVQTSCTIEGDSINLYTTVTMGETEYFQLNSIDLVDSVKALEPFKDRNGTKTSNPSFKGYIALSDDAIGVIIFEALANIGAELIMTPYGVKVDLVIYNRDVSLTLSEKYINLAVWGYSIVNTMDVNDATNCETLTPEQVAMLANI